MEEEKLYIGSKLIKGIPMDKAHFLKHYGKDNITITKGDNLPGYRVTYPDGYISWSPRAVFENAYRELSAAERELF